MSQEEQQCSPQRQNTSQMLPPLSENKRASGEQDEYARSLNSLAIFAYTWAFSNKTKKITTFLVSNIKSIKQSGKVEVLVSFSCQAVLVDGAIQFLRIHPATEALDEVISLR